jgi:ribosomal protein S27AE
MATTIATLLGVKWKLRGCPRCNGDLFTQRDDDGWQETCLQCGYTRNLIPLTPLVCSNGGRPPKGG